MEEVYQDELSNAKKPADKAALATKLLQAGRETHNDPAGRYVLFSLAGDIAAEVGEIETALVARRELATGYRTDGLSLEAEALFRLAKSVRPAARQKVLADHAAAAADRAVVASRFDLAGRLGDLAVNSSTRSGNAELARRAAARLKEIGEAEKAYAGVRRALPKLKKVPADPAANLEVGRYECFVKGEWDRGLRMLSKGADAPLKSVAEKDLLTPAKPDAQAAVGDHWWSLAEKEAGLAKKGMQQRADHWYRQAAPRLSGLAKAKVEKRLTALKAVLGSTPPVLAAGSPVAERPRPERDGEATGGDGGVGGDDILLFDGKTLQGWRTAGFTDHGGPVIKKGNLVLPAGATTTGVVYTGETPTMNYEVELEAQRLEGNDFFCGLTFPYGDSHATLIIGGWGGSVCGISNIDGDDAAHGPTTTRQEFRNGRWYNIHLKLTPHNIEASIDGRRIINVDTRGKRISTHPQIDPCKPFGLGAFKTTAAMRNIRIRPIEGPQK